VLSDIKWEFYLVQSKQANAFCLPDGKVVFYEGIMPVLTTPDMIAVVMSHEMGHAIARHGNERMTQQTLTNLVGAVTGQIIEQKTSENGRAIFETAYTIGSQYGYLLPYSRKHELEADEIGLYIMAIAGFDINQAPLLWQRMADASTTQVPEALSTHPSDERRMKNLQKLIEKARKFAAEVR
jgi:predicted Zn-dependent protease